MAEGGSPVVSPPDHSQVSEENGCQGGTPVVSPPDLSQASEDNDSQPKPASIKQSVQTIKSLHNVKTEEKKDAIAMLEKPKSLSVMACGSTGVGKSTLLNGICGQEVFVAGDFGSTTTKVKKYCLEQENNKLILFDTPGFHDESGNEVIYLQDLKENCADVETLFYCISLNHNRIIMKDDLSTLKNLCIALNKDVWKHCVIVFTFANAMIDTIKTDCKRELETKGKTTKEIEEIIDKHVVEEYKKRVNMWKESVLETFRKAGINPDKMPIVEAGYYKNPLLFNTDKLPWLSTLFEAIRTVSPEDKQAVLVLANKERIFYPNKSTKLPLHKQELIVLDPKTLKQKLKGKFPTIAAALAAGGTTGVASAGVGATIGALAIGVPTFGTAAGVGLLLGALIGGGIGVGVGAGTGTVIEKVRDS